MELDPWTTCPYNKQHKVPQSRIQAHIVKCEKNYPPLSICPYNATHRLEEQEMKLHVQTCPSKLELFPFKKEGVSGYITTPKPILQREYLPESDPHHEIWDRE